MQICNTRLIHLSTPDELQLQILMESMFRQVAAAKSCVEATILYYITSINYPQFLIVFCLLASCIYKL
jgi:hypothetical protein